MGNAAAGGTVNVPVFVKVVPGASLAGLQFRAIVTPGNAAPALTQNLQFISADGVTAPVTQSFRPGEIAVGWSLATVNYPAQSSNIVGWLRFAMPALAQAGQTYTVTFANTDGAPDRFTQYDFETRHAVIGVGTAASGSDFISDEWKLHFFGSLASAQADPNADPDGDGSPNWEEFLNGTAPDNALSKLKLAADPVQTVGKQKQLPLRWLSAPGKIYAVERTTSLTAPAWSNAGNITGDGYEQQFTETNLGSGGMFYRVRVISAP